MYFIVREALLRGLGGSCSHLSLAVVVVVVVAAAEVAEVVVVQVHKLHGDWMWWWSVT